MLGVCGGSLIIKFLANLLKNMQILQACIWKRQRNVEPKGEELYVPVVYTDYVLDIQKLDKNWERFSFSSYEILLQSFIASFDLIGTNKI